MRRLALIACVMLAGCEARIQINSEPVPKLDIRQVSSGGTREMYEIRHRGKVYLVVRSSLNHSAPDTKLDEWPDPEAQR